MKMMGRSGRGGGGGGKGEKRRGRSSRFTKAVRTRDRNIPRHSTRHNTCILKSHGTHLTRLKRGFTK